MSTHHTNAPWVEPAKWATRPVCVLGGGVLGRRIGACYVAAGRHVRIRDPSQRARDDSIRYIRKEIAAFTALSGKQPGTCQAVADLVEAVKDCWLVIEAVPEILGLKEDTFADLEKYAPDDCLLGTNSSSYKSSELIGKIGDRTKQRVFNAHFMMPPEAVIVELMTCGHTADGALSFVAERHRESGLHPVVALRESTGFIFNRIWAAIKREVLAVLSEGIATPETIDSMWIEQYVGRRVGQCSMMDAVGLDTVEHIEKHYIEDRSLPTTYLDWLREHFISRGKLGDKTDKGGLYPPTPPGRKTQILLLNIGLAEPTETWSTNNIFRSGQLLSYCPDNRNSRPRELVSKLPMPDAVVVSECNKRLYWTNMGDPKKNDGSIQCANLDGSNIEYVLNPGDIHTPKQMVIDPVSRKIYVCDREGLRIMRCDFNGGRLETIYESGDWKSEPEKVADARNWPVGITLSQRMGKMFWTQKGHSKSSEGRIFSADLEMPAGANPCSRSDISMVMQGLPECIDLEIDDESGVLYWTDRGEMPFGNTVNKKHLEGDVPNEEYALGRQIIAQGLGEGIGLSLDKENDCLYVTDMSGRLWKCGLDGGSKEKLYEGSTHAYTGVTFIKV